LVISKIKNRVKVSKKAQISDRDIPEKIDIIPLADQVLYPYTIIPLLEVKDERSIAAVRHAMEHDKIIGLVTIKSVKRKEIKIEEAKPKDFYNIGTVAVIQKMLKIPDGSLNLLVAGLSKIRILEYTLLKPRIRARVKIIPEFEDRNKKIKELMDIATRQLEKYVSVAPFVPKEIITIAINIEEPNKLAYLIASLLRMEIPEKQKILEIESTEDRLRTVVSILNREIDLLELGRKIQKDARESMEKSQREYFLRQQLKAIQKELGEVDEATREANEIKEKLQKSKVPEYVMKEANRELKRMIRIPPASPEYNVIRTYLDWLIELPWSKSTEDNLDLIRARKILDEDHYDLDDVKERIIEYLAVRKLKKDMKGPILCFVGPPGTGKTSVGQSIARALGRKFIRMSLGGIRDEAEIRGHRRTYIGALPGRILQSIRRAGSNNPVFMLDEVDKIGTDFRGDPSSALLEVLDPEQNFTFRDHYVELQFDLSKVMFITTANVLVTIHPALLDRMEVLELPGYTDEEKLQIALSYLIPKQIEAHGLTSKQIRFSEESVEKIISDYTKEAGVRNLEREIASVCRKDIATGVKKRVRITFKSIEKYLGPIKYFPEVALRTSKAGVATGLSWTRVGGQLVFVEATKMPGKKSFTLTGQLGEVMQESAKAALSYIRSKAKDLGIDPNFYDNFDIHLHVPAGAIKKDGPSAGITMATALASLLTNRPVSKDVAMTGEITLSGLVLPIGGVKEKVLAARRAGIKKVILPNKNEKDLKEIPKQHLKGLEFVFVNNVDEVLKESLV
jgi:ATP-dependent Lon protease